MTPSILTPAQGPLKAPDPGGPLLALRGLAVAASPSAREAIGGIDLVVGAGERIALVGPSGSGKTTLLRTLAGQIPARRGRVDFEGQGLLAGGSPPDRRRRARIAFVAQKHDLIEPLRVDKNVMAGALGRWSSQRALRFLFWSTASEAAEADAALNAVGLSGMRTRPTASLSGGEQQRVAIARALVQAPRLLLADEPIASLDAAAAADILGLLTRLARERGMALICSLHQTELAVRFFDRILEVREGRLLERSGGGAADGLRLV